MAFDACVRVCKNCSAVPSLDDEIRWTPCLDVFFFITLFFFKWYDPESDCWTDSGELFDLPYKRLRYCAATVEMDNRIYIFGGQTIGGVSPEGQDDGASSSEGVYSIENTVNWYQVHQRGDQKRC